VPGAGGTTADSVAAQASTEASYDAAYLQNPPPRYPISAYRERAQGTVILRVEVLPSGKSGEVVLQQTSGFDVLDEAAIATVRSWRFQPATRDGEPLKQWVNIPITFRLGQR
jgi:protein TonB